MRDALERLYQDALEIYEVARREVTITRSDGGEQKYAAVRYKQQIERAYATTSLFPQSPGSCAARPSASGTSKTPADRT
jgi:hypothetical protein